MLRLPFKSQPVDKSSLKGQGVLTCLACGVSCHLQWPWMTRRSLAGCKAFKLQFSEHLCNISHGFNWHGAIPRGQLSHLFCIVGLKFVTNRQRERQTTRYQGISSSRPHLASAAMWIQHLCILTRRLQACSSCPARRCECTATGRDVSARRHYRPRSEPRRTDAGSRTPPLKHASIWANVYLFICLLLQLFIGL